MNLPQGYNYKLIGEADTMARSFNEIVKAIVLAVVVVYMVLAAQFESFSQPVIIMASLPFAIVGAVLGLLMAGQTANMMSMIGFTMLLGLVTKNAILLIDYANQQREKGMDIRSATLEACSLRLRPILMTTLSTILGMLPIAMGIGEGDIRSATLEACSLRLRPILMTTLSTILGMLPIAMGIGEGAELRQSMGVVLVGGLVTSTLLTLLVVPVVYMQFEQWKAKHYKSAGEAQA